MADRIRITFESPARVRYERGLQDLGYDVGQAGLLLDTLNWLAHVLASAPGDPQQQEFLRVVGSNLFALVFPDDGLAARTARNDFIEQAERGRVCVEIVLLPDAAALSGLPWEFLYIPDQHSGVGGFFLADPKHEISLSRRLDGGPQLQAQPVPLRVFVVVSNPEGPRASVAGKALEEFLAGLSQRCNGKLILKFADPGADWESVHRDIGEFTPDIFHFRGHGERGGLWLTSNPDEVAAARAEVRKAQDSGDFSPGRTIDDGKLIWTKGVLSLFDKHTPSLVILEACQSGVFTSDLLANLSLPRVARHLSTRIPALVAMQYLINAKTAGTFMESLYQGIVEGRDVDEAVSHARAQLTHRRDNLAEFADRAFGAPIYLGSQGPLCSPIYVGFLTKCPSCGANNNRAGVPSFCSECGYQMNVRCNACQRAKRENFYTPNENPRQPVTRCRTCDLPFTGPQPGSVGELVV